MVGGLSRKRPPCDLALDPQSWPHAVVDDAAAGVVQAIARALADILETQERSLRQVAAGSEVNRQAIADLIAGRCWPDVATVARLENFLAVSLYPHRDGNCVMHRNRPSRCPGQVVPGTTK
ncbi:helix-turn-helix transcriptional regulator [Streptomyces sp. NPDC005336]|uniref:helix-turn-helix domain-containing protein n=1 Tax=Streptomyces sp. NPDC005336 TaxID=3157035 RepID=UPI0033B14FA1